MDSATAGIRGTPNWSDLELRPLLEHISSNALGRRVQLTACEWRPSPFSTLFPAEILVLRLNGDETLSVFVKHLGSEQADHPEKQCRDREVRIYRDLLTDGGLPVPRCFGSRWNDETGRHEVFLEYLDDWNLKYHGLDHWFAAARRLADLHVHFAARAPDLAACDFLLRFDEQYLREWAERALTAVADVAPALTGRLRRVVVSYGRVWEILSTQPLTLVHNDLAPKNVIADRSSDPARICFVDWEMAGLGCGMMDLVHLKYGLDPVNGEKMVAAYCAGLEGTSLLPASPREVERLVAACEIHKIVYRLAFSKTWRLGPERVEEWISETERFASLL